MKIFREILVTELYWFMHIRILYLYHNLVTEREVLAGILQTQNPENHCLCYFRTIENIDISCKLAARFIDMIDGKVSFF